MALRAFWQHHNRHNEIDRIEVHDAEFSGTEFEMCGDSTGFSFQHDEITSESNEKLINIQANRVQIGKLDFRPRIASTAGETLLSDIRDSDNKRFHIEWYKDGNFEWAGWITTRIFSYPEKESGFFAHIRATDFEILQGLDYPLSDTRQTFIDTFSGLFSELPVATPIRTATSWVEENVTAAVGSTTYDFLGKIYHETKALREFARTGDETPQPITKWEALEHVAEPALLIRQMNGHIYIDQITELADPTDVHETTYDSTGTVTTPTANVDRRQTGYTSVSSGTPAVKITSQNDTYPAIKRAKIKYNHRAKSSGIVFPDNIQQNSSFSQTFSSDGSQRIYLTVSVGPCEITGTTESSQGNVTLQAGKYWWDDAGNEWIDSNIQPVQEIDLDLTVQPYPNQNNMASGFFNIETLAIPSDADGDLVISFGVIGAYVDGPEYRSTLTIDNDITDNNSVYIDYQLTQSVSDFPTIIELQDTWYGDGPYNISAALRYSATGLSLTENTWQRRGSTDYRNYHENLLKEVIDMGRTNMRKLQADIWGSYDPSKVLDYNGSYFFYAGGKYDGVTGKWQVTLMELDLVEDGTDDFDDIPKFTDGNGSGNGSVGGGGSSGGGVDVSRGDARWLNESENLNDLDDVVTAQTNLKLKDSTASLDISSLITDQVELNNPASQDNHALRGGQVLQTTAPITGQDKLRNGVNVRLDYNTNNLKLTNAKLNTIQDIDQDADMLLNSLRTKAGLTVDDDNGYVRSQTFLGGFGGDGMEIEEEGGDWNMTVDNLTVRKMSRFYELVVEKVRANGGSIIVSPGAEAITKSTQTGDASWDFNETGFNPFAGDSPGGGMEYTFADQYECFIEEDKFITIDDDDLLRRQQWTGRGTGVTEGGVITTETGSATQTDNTPPRSFTMWITNDSEVPAMGMEFAVIGNSTNPDRQGGMIITASDDGAPYTRTYAGVDRLEKFGSMETTKGQEGRLDNIVTPNFSDLDGNQQNLFGAYWDGNIYINDGHFRGTIEVTDPDNSNAATKDYVNNAITSGGAVIIRSGSEPTQRSNGDALVVGDMWIDTSNGDKPWTYNGNTFVEAYTIIDGDDLITGSVTAAKVNTSDLYSVDANVTGRLRMKNGGDILVENNGEIRSTSGSYRFTDGVSRIAGSYFDATDMWGGSSSKSNASVRLDFANGRIYYDAMTQVVFSQSSTASYGSNQSNSDPIGTSVWEVQSSIVNPPGSATTTKQDSNDTIIIRCPYVHRFGFNYLQFTGFIDWLYTENGSPSIEYRDAIITMTVNGYSESTTISSSVSAFRNVAIDIGSSGANLSEGNIYTVRIKIESRVRGSLDADESMDVKCSVRDDAMILATT